MPDTASCVPSPKHCLKNLVPPRSQEPKRCPFPESSRHGTQLHKHNVQFQIPNSPMQPQVGKNPINAHASLSTLTLDEWDAKNSICSGGLVKKVMKSLLTHISGPESSSLSLNRS